MSVRVKRVEIAGLSIACAVTQFFFASYAPWALYFDFPLAATLYIGWHGDPGRGARYGTLLGLIQDVCGSAPYMGLNGFSKTLVGYLASYLSKWVVSEAFPLRMGAAFAVSLVDGLAVFGIQKLFGVPLIDSIWLDTLARAAVTGVGAALFFRVYDRFKFPRKDFRRR